MVKKLLKKAKNRIKTDNERGARHQLIEELFYDFSASHKEVYWINFVRGIFFGFGTVLGGTVLVAIIIWILGQFFDWLPLTQQIIDSFQRTK
ncbi:MAG TPA: DUF5665 domain-containing protein [Candidatus Saccharimonadales bacterium]|nr:DUF5665 domain-containing protein [Candidatus Saccharimonadales bacterium]